MPTMNAKIISLSDVKSQKNSGTKCPQCGASAVKPHTPFCSRRCAQLDLGKWLNEEYRVPADDMSAEGIDVSDVDALLAELEKDE